jgi:hypothetical protein
MGIKDEGPVQVSRLVKPKAKLFPDPKLGLSG